MYCYTDLENRSFLPFLSSCPHEQWSVSHSTNQEIHSGDLQGFYGSCNMSELSICRQLVLSKFGPPSLFVPSPLGHHPKGNALPTQVLVWQPLGKLVGLCHEPQLWFPDHEGPHPQPSSACPAWLPGKAEWGFTVSSPLPDKGTLVPSWHLMNRSPSLDLDPWRFPSRH